MRIATIGEDGVIRDADGIAYHSGARRQAKRLAGQELFPQIGDEGEEVGLDLGQADPGAIRVQAPLQKAPDRPGPAFLITEAKTIPTSQLTFTRNMDANPEAYLFPGRIVLSSAPEYQLTYRTPDGRTVATGTIFRVGARPSKSEETVLLLSVEGKKVGEYVEVPLLELMSEKFRVVPPEMVSTTALNYVTGGILTPYIEGRIDTERPTVSWVVTVFDQASYALGTPPVALTPVEFNKRFNDIRAWIMSAVGFIQEGLEMSGAAYDYNNIGKKGYCILTRVGTDILNRLIGLAAKIDLKGPETLLGTTDQARIDGFWKMVDAVNERKEYWAALLARATLYQYYTLFHLMLVNYLYSETLSDWNLSTLESITANRAEIEASVVGKNEEGVGPITPERAKALMGQAIALYQALVQMDKDDTRALHSWNSAAFGSDFTPADLPLVLGIYANALKENAQEIMKIRKRVSGRVPFCREPGLGTLPVAGFAKIMASLPTPDPGIIRRQNISSRMARDFSSRYAAREASDIVGQRKGLEEARKNIIQVADFLKKEMADSAELLRGGSLDEFRGARAAARSQLAKLQADLESKELTPENKPSPQQVAEVRSRVQELEHPDAKMLAREALKFSAARLERLGEKAIFTEEMKAEELADRMRDVAKDYGQIMSEIFRGPGPEGTFEFRSLGDAYALEFMAMVESPERGYPPFIIERLQAFRKLLEGPDPAKTPYHSPEAISDFLNMVLESMKIDPQKFVADIVNIKKPELKKNKVVRQMTETVYGTRLSELNQLVRYIRGADTGAYAETLDKDLRDDMAIVREETSLPPGKRSLSDDSDVARIIEYLEKGAERFAEPEVKDGKKVPKTGGIYTRLLARIDEDPKLGKFMALFNRPEILKKAQEAYSEARTIYNQFFAKFKDAIAKPENIKVNFNKLAIREALARLESVFRKATIELSNLEGVYRKYTFSPVRMGLSSLEFGKKAWEVIQKGAVGFHNSVVGKMVTKVMYAVFGVPWILGFAFLPFSFIASLIGALPWSQKFLPLEVVATFYAGLVDIVRPSGGYDAGPDLPGGGAGAKDPKADPAMSSTTKLILLGVGVSLIFAGGKVFTAVDRFFFSIARIIDSVIKVLTPKPVKRKPGRPAAEDRRPRGRPPKLEKAKDEVTRAEEALKVAEDTEDPARIERAKERLDRAEEKVKKAEEAEFMKGMIGDFWRLNDA